MKSDQTDPTPSKLVAEVVTPNSTARPSVNHKTPATRILASLAHGIPALKRNASAELLLAMLDSNRIVEGPSGRPVGIGGLLVQRRTSSAPSRTPNSSQMGSPRQDENVHPGFRQLPSQSSFQDPKASTGSPQSIGERVVQDSVTQQASFPALTTIQTPNPPLNLPVNHGALSPAPKRHGCQEHPKMKKKQKKKPEMNLHMPPNPFANTQVNTTPAHATANALPAARQPSVSQPSPFSSARSRTPQHSVSPPPTTPQSEGQRVLYEDSYQFTGTSEDLEYLQNTWMNIEEADVNAYLRRFYRYIKGSGLSAIASPAGNAKDSATEGILVILTKWQSIHHTRIGATPKDCALNGALVGQHIASRAFQVGHASLLPEIAKYFDNMKLGCEEQARTLSAEELADYQQLPEMSWLTCLKADWNFFGAARHKIIEVIRAEQQKKNAQAAAYNNRAMGPGGVGGVYGGEFVACSSGFGGSTCISTAMTTPTPSFACLSAGGPSKKAAATLKVGSVEDHGFPQDNIISSDLRSLPPRSGSSAAEIPTRSNPPSADAMEVDSTNAAAPRN